MSRLRKYMLLSMAAVLLRPWPAPAVEIIYPPNNALLTETETVIAGHRAESAGAGTIRMRSPAMEKDYAVEPGLFSITASLTPGFNYFHLDGQEIRIFHSPKMPSVKPPLILPSRHAVDNGCEDCHYCEEEGGPLVDEVPALCFNCHDDVTLGEDGEPLETLHSPVEEGECLECHDLHGSTVPFYQPLALMELCLNCHDDFTEGITDLRLIHAPVRSGSCVGCHNPHASGEEVLLRVPAGEICMNCHDDPAVSAEGGEWETPHAALDDGCGTCHAPHTAGNLKLLVSDMGTLCGECHDDKRVDPKGMTWDTPHPPVDEDDCTSCHSPHGSDQPAILARELPELCVECHDDKRVDPEGNEWATPHPPVDEEDCSVCHDLHGSMQSALLTRELPDLCVECHEDKRLKEDGDDWLAPHAPVLKGLCQDCHQTHGSTEGALLAQPAIKLCEQCHKAPHDQHMWNDESEKIEIPPSFPQTKEGRLECAGCHLPHGSDIVGMWRDRFEVLCIECHSY